MKTKIYGVVLAIVLSVFAFSPLLNSRVSAVTCDPGLVPTTSGLCLPTNSIGTTTTANTLILRGINILLGIAAAIAILFLIIGGFQYITSAGNEESAKKGRQTVVNALIGLAIVILSFAIVTIVNNTVSGCSGFGSLVGIC